MARSLVLSAVLLVVAGCAGGSGGIGGGSPSPVPQPSTGRTLTAGELRLHLIDELGPLWYCDRDSNPVARDEQEAALATYPTMAADTEIFPAVAAKLGIDVSGSPTDAQKLALYRLWKVASAVSLDPIGNDRYRFDYLAQPAGNATQGTRTGGVIDSRGVMTVEQQAAADAPMCPICLSLGTLIDAPSGAIPVERLRLGDIVWTLDASGDRVPGTVIAVGSTPAPAGHHVIRLTLADGRTVTASPGHPLGDGRTLGGLTLGDTVDGAAVTDIEDLAYAAPATYDLVVSGETGVYLAGGIPLASTIDGRRQATFAPTPGGRP